MQGAYGSHFVTPTRTRMPQLPHFGVSRKQCFSRDDLLLHAKRVDKVITECKLQKLQQIERERIDARVRSLFLGRGRLSREVLERDQLQRQKTQQEAQTRVALCNKKRLYTRLVHDLFAPRNRKSPDPLLRKQTEVSSAKPVSRSISPVSPHILRRKSPRSPTFSSIKAEPIDWLGDRRRRRNRIIYGKSPEPTICVDPLGTEINAVRQRTRVLETQLRQQELLLSDLDDMYGLELGEQLSDGWIAAAKAKLSVII